MNNEMKETPIFHKFFFLGGSIIAIITIGGVGYAIFLVHQYLVIVGYFWLVSFAIMPAIAIVAACTCLARYILKIENIELGPSGNLIKRFGKITEYHPLGIKEPRVRIKEEKEKFVVPTLLDILKTGMLGNGDLLLGYHKEGDQRWGTWDDLRTFVVAGKSRSGKTVTMTFFIVQALLEGAVVCVCDPHATKPTGLLKALAPIIPFLKTARNYDEIYNLSLEYKAEMDARKADEDRPLRPWLIVYDEWSELLREMETEHRDVVVDMVLGCGEAYAGYNGFCMVGGQEWTANESGGKKGGAVRRAFHAAVVHKIDDEYSKHLMKGQQGKKLALKTPMLPRGQAYFKGANDDDFDYLLFPFYGKEREALFEVASMLGGNQLPGPEKQQELSGTEIFTQFQNRIRPLSLPEKIDREEVKPVKPPVEPMKPSPNSLESGEDSEFDPADNLYTHEKEIKLLRAAFQLAQKNSNFTRKDLMEHLGWTRKQWTIIKAVCDKHQIAITGGK